MLDFSVCWVDPTSYIWAKVTSIIQMVNGAAVCILAIAQFVKQSLQMYRVTRRWQLNQYMGLLAKQGILYFLAWVLSFPPASSATIQAHKLTNFDSEPN